MTGILDRTRPSILTCDENDASQLPDLLAAVDFTVAVSTPEALDADLDASDSSPRENATDDHLPGANACVAGDMRSELAEDSPICPSLRAAPACPRALPWATRRPARMSKPCVRATLNSTSISAARSVSSRPSICRCTTCS
jgi:hypothetical protein